jgi:chromosome segregation ATPase
MAAKSSSDLPKPPPFPTRHQARPPLVLQRRTRNATAGQHSAELPQTTTVSINTEDATRFFRQLESALAERERAIGDAEARLMERTRDLDELDALLRAREALLASTKLRHAGNRKVVTAREAEAVKNLKAELDRQEVSVREAREALRAREKYLEECETRLFEKVQQQQEKESELEQREEDLKLKLETAPVGKAAKVFDEFRE